MQRGETELRSCLLFFSFLEVTPSVLCEIPPVFPSVPCNPFFFIVSFVLTLLVFGFYPPFHTAALRMKR